MKTFFFALAIVVFDVLMPTTFSRCGRPQKPYTNKPHIVVPIGMLKQAQQNDSITLEP